MTRPMAERPASESAAAASPLARRLIAPEMTVALDDLPRAWVAATVAATVPGHGALADDLVVMNRIRGALGRMLMAGASHQAVSGAPCPWDPPCALDLLYREQARLDRRHGLPKPWVLALDRHDLDLIVTVTLFGFAIEWAGVVGHALVEALRGQIDWHERAPSLFLPAAEVDRLTIREIDGVVVPRPRESALLDLLTPLDAAGDDPLDRPATVIGRLARRVDLMARWMGVAVDTDWPALAAHWNGLAYDTTDLHRRQLDRRSGRARQAFTLGLVGGSLGVAGDLAPLWPLLVLGQSCHAGRGGTAGLGRYALR